MSSFLAKDAASAGSNEWVNFELGEDVRDENRLRQDEEWAGAVADGRAHVSHRETAMLNAPQICMAIADFRLVDAMVDAMHNNNGVLGCITPEILTCIVEYAMPGQGDVVTACVERRRIAPLLHGIRGNKTKEVNSDFPFRICVRKRPMLDFEHAFGAYDVCDSDNGNVITLHEGRLARNARQLYMAHHQYVVDRVFSGTADNAEVCADAVEPLLDWAETGRSSTLLCFGQTGTGKTFTLYGALEYLSKRLIGRSIRVTFYEVHGTKCYDLLSNRRVVHLRSDENEVMHVRGAKTVSVSPLCDASELIAVLREALQLRSSKVTERNPISSRSHAVCTIEISTTSVAIKSTPPTTTAAAATTTAEGGDTTAAVTVAKADVQDVNLSGLSRPKYQSLAEHMAAMKNTVPASADAATDKCTGELASPQQQQQSEQLLSPLQFGKLTLVDLAGSERNYETTQMTAAQHKESAHINFALMALKNCFRAYHAHLAFAEQIQSRNTTINDDNINTKPEFSFSDSGKLKVKVNDQTLPAGAVADHNGSIKDMNTVATAVITAATDTGAVSRMSSMNSKNSSGFTGFSRSKATASKSRTAADIATATDVTSLLSASATSTSTGVAKTAGEEGGGGGVSTVAVPKLPRIEFRATLLTKVLKECFTAGPQQHRTTIIATVSPTPTDLQHSINTLAHVVLMCPDLSRLTHRVCSDMPLTAYGTAHLSRTPVSDWSAAEVRTWLAQAERGRFAHVVLPAGIDGAGLLQLSANNLSELFAREERAAARNIKEGQAWIETAEENNRKVKLIGRQLWSALRREMQNILARTNAGNSINI